MLIRFCSPNRLTAGPSGGSGPIYRLISNNLTGVLLMGAAIVAGSIARAEPPATTVFFQPMVSTGLAAQNPFEAWFVFDKSSDPRVPGYAIPAGATIRFTFPEGFTPKPGGSLGAVMLKGWAQGALPAKFTTTLDEKDPRTVVVRFSEGTSFGPAEAPGLKAIHLRTNVINPPKAGDYPITIQFINAGPLSGQVKATATITAKPQPNIAAYNQLHQSKDEDWQHVKAGEEALLPIDFLVTLPDAPRSTVSLKTSDSTVLILSDGKPIGSIKTEGVPVTLTPEAFGPGFARLGIIRVHAKAGNKTGLAKIIAKLDEGTSYPISLIVE
jgi:hypothetical protein